jgi:hypothetical protein
MECDGFTLNGSGCALKRLVRPGDPPVKVVIGMTSGLNTNAIPLPNCTGEFKYGAGKCWLTRGSTTHEANWSTARNDCSSKKAHLAQFHSQLENDFAFNYVLGGSYMTIAWIGAQCQGGQYHWNTTGRNVTDGWTNFEDPSLANCTDGTALVVSGHTSGKSAALNWSEPLRTWLCSYQP